MTAQTGYTLGVNAGHDATATLLNPDGEIVAAIAEERLSRVKFHPGFPYRATAEVLRIAGVTPDQVSEVASATQRLFFAGADELNALSFDRTTAGAKVLSDERSVTKITLSVSALIAKNLGASPEPPLEDFMTASEKLTSTLMRRELDSLGFGNAALSVIDHHQCHAGSAFYASALEDPLIVTVDGSGDGLCGSVAVVENGVMKRVAAIPASCSPGLFYSGITRFLGYRPNRHEGKITGLAAFGDCNRLQKDLGRFLNFDESSTSFRYTTEADPKLVRKLRTLVRILSDRHIGGEYADALDSFLRRNFDPKKDARDLAAGAQAVLEDSVGRLVARALKQFPRKTLAVAGGVFANVRLNQKLAESPGVTELVVHPDMGDGGCAAGAAFVLRHELRGARRRGYRPENVYFGPGYTASEIEGALRANGIEFERPDDMEKTVARLIHEGRVIGRFEGRMEYGPRALGSRSILARPTDKSINDWLNKKLNRTEFMPFAPSVLEPFAKDLFVNYRGSAGEWTSSFMTITYEVVPSWREPLQAAVHVDGTARPQVVSPSQNAKYYRLIDEYRLLSGIPAVVNTSFNMHEEPIVCTPDDAIRAFRQGCIDYLAIGDFLCRSRAS